VCHIADEGKTILDDRRLRKDERMPAGKSPGPSVKKPKTYEALKEKGMSKERAAKISNAQANKEKKKG
jgi:hypothetical protein